MRPTTRYASRFPSLIGRPITLSLFAWTPFVWIALGLVLCCGPEPVVQDPLPDKLPPNVAQACERAIVCGIFMEQQRGACEACLEHIDQVQLDDLRERFGDLPPLDTVSCETLSTVAGVVESRGTIRSCVVGQWYGPGER